jgi:hypothetical protein
MWLPVSRDLLRLCRAPMLCSRYMLRRGDEQWLALQKEVDILKEGLATMEGGMIKTQDDQVDQSDLLERALDRESKRQRIDDYTRAFLTAHFQDFNPVSSEGEGCACRSHG